MCVTCPVGADCVAPGSTLELLPLEAGYWRSGSTTTDVRRCQGTLSGSSCVGCGGQSCLALNFTGCKPSTTGPYCGLCDAERSGVYFDQSQRACLPCRGA